MLVFEELVELLKEKGMTVSAAESCTGGLFASNVVSVPDASKVLSASFVTYSEEAKSEFAGVDNSIIDTYGVVSENVAVAMALGVCKKAKADVGVGITGYAGPAKDENDTSAGTVCFGFAVKGKTLSVTRNFGDVGRNAVRELAVMFAANTLMRFIKNIGDR